MWDFHYNYIQNKSDDEVEMLTDTDSNIHKIEPENVYEDLYKDKQLFHFSSYPEDSKYWNNTNDLIVGKMKNETWNLSLKSFERLTSKMYTS